jgi:hypothetical protein
LGKTVRILKARNKENEKISKEKEKEEMSYSIKTIGAEIKGLQ